ncbi:hypothetical protein NY671_21925, partial [Xanthomonas hortorum pv. pelargonii]
THHATSLASGDSSIHPARRRSCDRRLMVRANQEKVKLMKNKREWFELSYPSTKSMTWDTTSDPGIKIRALKAC